MIKVFSNKGCPQCKILKSLLTSKNIPFEVNENMEDMKVLNIKHLPTVQTETGELLNFKEAFNKYKNIQ